MRLTIGLGEVYDLKPVAIDRTGAERSDVSVKLATSNKKYVAVNGTQVKGVKVGLSHHHHYGRRLRAAEGEDYRRESAHEGDAEPKRPRPSPKAKR